MVALAGAIARSQTTSQTDTYFPSFIEVIPSDKQTNSVTATKMQYIHYKCKLLFKWFFQPVLQCMMDGLCTKRFHLFIPEKGNFCLCENVA